jgi:hypothetical protein
MSDLLLRATAKAGLSEDDPLYAVVAAQSEMIESFIASVSQSASGTQSASGNGTHPIQLKAGQLAAIENTLKSLPNHADLQSIRSELLKEIRNGGGENKLLAAFLEAWSVDQARKRSRKATVTDWLIRIGVIAVVFVVVFGSGFFTCWVIDHRSNNPRADKPINFQQSDTPSNVYKGVGEQRSRKPRPWKRTLSASDSGPTPWRAKSDFLSVSNRIRPS